MARGKSPQNVKKWQMIRYVAVCAAWAVWLYVALSLISYDGRDRTIWGNPNTYAPEAATQNWCGTVGASVAYVLLNRFGPGVLVILGVLAGFLGCWSAKRDLSSWPLRFAGAALLAVVLSCVMHLIGGPSALIDRGGHMGMEIGGFLKVKFGIGAGLILFLTAIVGLLLLADEIMLAVPGFAVAAWQRLPRKQLAGAAGGTAGGLWGGIKEMIDGWGNRGMGKVEKGPRKRKTLAEGEKGEVAPVAATAAEEEPAVAEVVEEKDVKAAAEGEEATLFAPREPVIRKPMAPPTPAAPVLPRPIPANAPKQDLGNYKLPGSDLLDEPEPLNLANQEARVREKAQVLNATLESYNINGRVEAIDTGPVVTLYELDLAPGVKSSQVSALSKDIARALKSPPVRIIENIPGKSTLGIEVPNLDRERVRLKDLFAMGQSQIERMALPMCLGKDASGNPLIEDLSRVPHMLIAGTTGSGKSVCINSIIMTLLMTKRPDEVKMIMVDPKMVEMQDYKAIPHLMAPIIDDMTKAESILEWACGKMDERYEIMSEASVRNIKDYNRLTKEQIIERFNATTEDDKAKLVFKMPYIVIIIDELADLMMTSKEVEGHIVRIAQKARAVGIHLILATQRPEAQVVTGLIKSNMPGRICFQVRSRLDSRIMLDQSGGELLLGQGDMMMLKPTGGGLIRAQGAFVDDKEIKNVCRFLKEIAEPEFHPELMQLGAAGGLQEGEEKDPLYNDAVDIMIESGRGSVSLIQRRLNIGYSRASRIIDQLRRTGIVGAYKGSMASEVTVSKEEWEAMKAEEAGTLGNAAAAEYADEEGQVGSRAGVGKNVGYAQQVNSTFDEDDDDDGSVPDEMPGEHRY